MEETDVSEHRSSTAAAEELSMEEEGRDGKVK